MGIKKLIIVPHSDDEVLLAGGIICEAVRQRLPIKVAIVTNGDYGAATPKKGQTRLRETLAATALLGLSSEDVIFLGYADTGMSPEESFLHRLYCEEDVKRLYPSGCGCESYALPEHPEYHLSHYGAHAPYCRASLTQDFTTLLEELHPEEIFTTSQYDLHADHGALFFFIRDALAALYTIDPNYRPTLWCGLVHSVDGDLCWPLLQSSQATLDAFTQPRLLEETTELHWSDRTTFLVPKGMTSRNVAENLKYRALCCYTSALRADEPKVCQFLLSFAKADEVFWNTSYAPSRRLLFIGDSVTDGGRTYAGTGPYGDGFVRKIKDYLHCFYAFEGYTVFNRGVSGNEAVHLAARWQQDCLMLRPDVVTLMVGINDCGRRYDENRPTTVEQFEATLCGLLMQLREALPQAKIILMEPYLTDALPEQRSWREDLEPKQAVIKQLAQQFGADFIPLDSLFAEASTHRLPSYWAPDGVHPSDAGSSLIALSWLRATGFSGEGEGLW